MMPFAENWLVTSLIDRRLYWLLLLLINLKVVINLCTTLRNSPLIAFRIVYSHVYSEIVAFQKGQAPQSIESAIVSNYTRPLKSKLTVLHYIIKIFLRFKYYNSCRA